MTELLQIQEPGRVKLPAPQWAAFLELGFRPLYLAGCFWAAVSVAMKRVWSMPQVVSKPPPQVRKKPSPSHS